MHRKNYDLWDLVLDFFSKKNYIVIYIYLYCVSKNIIIVIFSD
jgi:hypothetical protein